VQQWQNGLEFPVYILSGFLFPSAPAQLDDAVEAAAHLLGSARCTASSANAPVEETLFAWGMMIVFSVIYLFIANRLFRKCSLARRCGLIIGKP
jgi:hypothetical protein